jgi:hypothetical protein
MSVTRHRPSAPRASEPASGFRATPTVVRRPVRSSACPDLSAPWQSRTRAVAPLTLMTVGRETTWPYRVIPWRFCARVPSNTRVSSGSAATAASTGRHRASGFASSRHDTTQNRRYAASTAARSSTGAGDDALAAAEVGLAPELRVVGCGPAAWVDPSQPATVMAAAMASVVAV